MWWFKPYPKNLFPKTNLLSYQITILQTYQTKHMAQFIILAKDGTDEGALDRRMAARPAHFEMAKKLKANGNFVIGGATLDENGKMNGSMMVVEFEDESGVKHWFEEEPYLLNGVWVDVEVKPFKVAVLD